MNPNYAVSARTVDTLDVDSRSTFISRTYAHLFGAIIGFTVLELAYFSTGMAETLVGLAQGNWLIFLGGFMVVGWLATRTAHTSTSQAAQYAALAGYVFADSLLFAPLLYIASVVAPGAIQSAGVVTLLGFSGLTAVAFITRRDFSFLRGMLMWMGIMALIAIVASIIFGVTLGMWFSVAMIGFAGAAVLYDTSNVLHHYPEDRYVGAALQLFASIALLFWSVLRLFMSLSRD